MIRIPLSEVKQKITEKTGMTEPDIDKKIEEKLVQLAGLISKEGAAHIIANELGVKLFEGGGKIKDIYPGMRSVSVNAKVSAVYEAREFKRADGSMGKVCSALIRDETGSTRLVGWNDQAAIVAKLAEGNIIAVSGGRAQENNKGYKEIHLNEKSKVDINPEGITINVGSGPTMTENFSRKKIAALSEADNAIEILGTIVQVFDIRFFEVCPQCSMRVKQVEAAWECPTHKLVTPDYSYVLNIFLEDDTERIRIVLFSNLIESITKKPKTDLLAYRQAPERFEEIKTQLLGEQFKMQGKIKKNTFFDRIEFVPTRVYPADPAEELKNLETQTK